MIKVFDHNLQLVAYLENAFDVSYEQRLNELWMARFSLPADDEKNQECLPLRFVELFDGEERIDLFRIVPTTKKRDGDEKTITYECEHVLATLLDDILFQYHERIGITTAGVINYILSHQTVPRWQIGQVDFALFIPYKWENENLLGSVFSVAHPLIGPYQWTWDTEAYPWTLNLVSPSTELQTEIHYTRNLEGVTRREDPTRLVTRLYALGYGEGVNQLTIESVNSGIPYLDADTLPTYGVVSRIYIDKKEESPAVLKSKAEAILEELKHPLLSYAVNAVDLYKITDDEADKFQIGTVVRVVDEELGIDTTSFVVTRSKGDIYDDPGGIRIEIANKTQDIATSISDLADRTRINEVYAQGATNLDSHDFADNADPEHPAVLRFYIPEETVRINKVQLSYKCEAFRAFSKAIEGGGAIQKSTEAGGATIVSSDSESYDDTVGWDTGGMIGSPTTLFDGGHSHSLTISSDGDHFHYVTEGVSDTDGDHTHPFSSVGSESDHVHIMGDHKHFNRLIEHSHEIILPNHVHEMIIPDHVHGIQYGIYEGPTPTSITVTVDDSEVPGMGAAGNNVDLVAYLSKDSEGKIHRGWHEIKIAPNNLGRIVASVNTQIFVQSRGGGNY